MSKTSFLGLRISPELKKQLQDEAEMLNISISKLAAWKLENDGEPYNVKQPNLREAKNVKQTAEPDKWKERKVKSPAQSTLETIKRAPIPINSPADIAEAIRIARERQKHP